MTKPKPFENSYWVDRQLVAGEYPGARDEPHAQEKIGALLDAGVTHFIDLTEAHEPLEPYASLLEAEAARRAVGVRYERLPIRDVHIPTSAHMADILESLAASISKGEVVYVHCWGGVGRTGTVIACHLIERGLDAEAALQRVETLFATMSLEKRNRHPRSPEAHAQFEFVRNWPKSPLSRAALVRRTRGCLLAGAAGDALGAAVEFNSAQTIRTRFGPMGIRDFVTCYGRVGAITDDTQMTLFTAEGILTALRGSPEAGASGIITEIHDAYLRWFATQGQPVSSERLSASAASLFAIPELHAPRAPGTTCLGALHASNQDIELRGQPALNDSKGCGGVMRAAPAGLIRAWSPEEAFAIGRDLAALTHGHSTGHLAAGAFAQIIRLLLGGTELAAAIQQTLKHLEQQPHSTETSLSLQDALRLGEANAGEQAGSAAHDRAFETLGDGWVAEEALAIGVYAALAARGSLEEGICIAVNHGGDSDSTGSIAGNLLGVIHGEDAIPQRWLDQLELRDVIGSIAEDLAKASTPRWPD